MDAVEKLLAIEEIKILKARYFYFMDVKDWKGLASVFTDDAVMDMRGEFPGAPDPSVYVFKGAEGIANSIAAGVQPIVTIHQGYMPIIEIEGPESATGIWALEDNFFMPDGNHMHGYGHYHEQYRKVDGRWRIAHTQLARLRKTAGPAPQAASLM